MILNHTTINNVFVALYLTYISDFFDYFLSLSLSLSRSSNIRIIILCIKFIFPNIN